MASLNRLTQINQSKRAFYLGRTLAPPMIVSGRFGANFKQNGGVHWIYNYCVTVFFFHEYSGMDERIIRLCEENNVTSLVQTLSSLKSQKVRMLQR